MQEQRIYIDRAVQTDLALNSLHDRSHTRNVSDTSQCSSKTHDHQRFVSRSPRPGSGGAYMEQSALGHGKAPNRRLGSGRFPESDRLFHVLRNSRISSLPESQPIHSEKAYLQNTATRVVSMPKTTDVTTSSFFLGGPMGFNTNNYQGYNHMKISQTPVAETSRASSPAPSLSSATDYHVYQDLKHEKGDHIYFYPNQDIISSQLSPPKPIPALHGPLSLPYARCPSGAEGTLVEETQNNLPGLIWGLSSAGNHNQLHSTEAIKRTNAATPPPSSPSVEGTVQSSPTIIQDAPPIDETIVFASLSAKPLATRRVVSAPNVLTNRDRKMHYSEHQTPTVIETDDCDQEKEVYLIGNSHLNPPAASQARPRRSSACASITTRLAANQQINQYQRARKYGLTDYKLCTTTPQQDIIDIAHPIGHSNDSAVSELFYPSSLQLESTQGSSQADSSTKPWTVYDAVEKRTKPFSAIEESVLRSPAKMYQNPAFAQDPSSMTSTLDNLLKDLRANPLSSPGPPPTEPLPPLPAAQGSHFVPSVTARTFHPSLSSATNTTVPAISYSSSSATPLDSSKKSIRDADSNVSVPKNLRSVPLKRLAHRRLESITEESSFRSSDGRSPPNTRLDAVPRTHTLSDVPQRPAIADSRKPRVKMPRSVASGMASDAYTTAITMAHVTKIVSVPPRVIGQVEFRDGVYRFKEGAGSDPQVSRVREEASMKGQAKEEDIQTVMTEEDREGVDEDDTIRVRPGSRVGISTLSTNTT